MLSVRVDTAVPKTQDGSVGFFDEFPLPPTPPERPRMAPNPWDGPPAGWLGGWVPWRIVLARSDRASALLRDFEAFPTGVHFTLIARFRDDSPLQRPGPGRHLPFFGHERGPRFGVAFADGRKTVAGAWLHQTNPGHPEGPILRQGGGGGGGGSWRTDFWLWPLPPPGPLNWIAEWSDQGVPENSVQVDASVLAEAAAEAEQLWEVDPNESGGLGWTSSQVSFGGGDVVRHDPGKEPTPEKEDP